MDTDTDGEGGGRTHPGRGHVRAGGGAVATRGQDRQAWEGRPLRGGRVDTSTAFPASGTVRLASLVEAPGWVIC